MMEMAPDPGQDAEARRFPLGLCMVAVITTGAGLAASTCGLRWGAGPAGTDALDVAWLYVNIALTWTILALWPAIAMARLGDGRRGFLRDVAVLAVAAIPAMSVAGSLSGVTALAVCYAITMHVGTAIFAAGVMSWRVRIPPATIAGVLIGLAVVMPIVAYAWAEFFPAAGQGWIVLAPMLAIGRAAEGTAGSAIWWVAGFYAVVGMALWMLAPRALEK